MTAYRVTFDRIGRDHAVPPLVAEAADAEDLAGLIYQYARPHLRSRDYTVDVDLDDGEGFIACGMHSGGSFTIQTESEPK